MTRSPTPRRFAPGLVLRAPLRTRARLPRSARAAMVVLLLLGPVRPGAAGALRLASGVVPHHAVARPLITAFYRRIASLGTPQTIVVVSPDHFRASSVTGMQLCSVEDGENLGITVDVPLLEAIRGRFPVATSTLRVAADHGITVQLAFIKKHFPAARIVPLLIARGTTRKTIDALARLLHHAATSRTVVIASVDFSHYLPREAAAFHDVKSIRVLLDFERGGFSNLELDCWQALYLARLYARLRGMEAPLPVGAASSLDFLHANDGESTTSYFSVVFTTQDAVAASSTSPVDKGRSVLLLGDIMLGRKVRLRMKEHGTSWPFHEMRQLLRGADIVLGNLEGPVVRRKLAGREQRFGFHPSVAELLASVRVNLLSLANNHTLDQGRPGLEETRRHLSRWRLGVVGRPEECGTAAVRVDQGLLVLGFNLVGRSVCPAKKVVAAVKRSRTAHPHRFIIVTVHWGSEYVKSHSWWQEELAHNLIDAGADLIMGHHPHVVQDIELYRNRLVFYSLGNFIFDQYSMADTEEGLAVGVTLHDRRTEYRLFPYRSNRSQPKLMQRGDAALYLSELAGRSSAELLSSIRRGKLVLDRLTATQSITKGPRTCTGTATSSGAR